MGFNYDTYDQTITDFNLPAYRVGDARLYMKNNVQYGSMWGTVWAKNTSMLPAGAQSSASEFQVNDDGYLVWVGSGNTWKDGITKTLWGTSTNIDGKPIIGVVQFNMQMKLVMSFIKWEQQSLISVMHSMQTSDLKEYLYLPLNLKL